MDDIQFFVIQVSKVLMVAIGIGMALGIIGALCYHIVLENIIWLRT